MSDSINKFQGAITRTTAAIGVKTSAFVGGAKIKTHITTLNKEIATMKQELGESIYESWLKGDANPELITQWCKQIKEKHESIAELEAELAKLERHESEVLGEKKLESGAAHQVGSNDAAVVCSNCSATYSEPIKFCRKCGTKMA